MMKADFYTPNQSHPVAESNPDAGNRTSNMLRRLRIALGGGALAAVLVSGCAPDNDMPDRNAPAETAAYFLDKKEWYYERIGEVLETTDDPVARNNIEELMHTPIARWLNRNNEITGEVVRYDIEHSAEQGSIPLFVAYNITQRDLGGQAGGGMPDAAAYMAWIKIISDTIGDHDAVMILEPDALAGVFEMESEDHRNERYALLRDSLVMFRDNNENTAVYLDVGHNGWLTPEEVTMAIKAVDPNGDIVTGIALNVSYQDSESAERDYANRISELLGRELYVFIDNSMNGAPNTEGLTEWCNAVGEKIGVVDDYNFNPQEPVEEAFVKAPGESDGNCGSSTAVPGLFDSELLLRQVS